MIPGRFEWNRKVALVCLLDGLCGRMDDEAMSTNWIIRIRREYSLAVHPVI